MSVRATIAGACCLAVFHSPDGQIIRIDTHHISAVRSADYAKGHVAPGVKAILSAGQQNFGVIETPEEAEREIKSCVDEQD
jgi:hypothetical protein